MEEATLKRDKALLHRFNAFQANAWELSKINSIDQFVQSDYYKSIPEIGRSMTIQCNNAGYCQNYARQCDLCKRNLVSNLADYYLEDPKHPDNG